MKKSLVILGVSIALFSCITEKEQYIIFPNMELIDTIPFSSTPDSNIILLEVQVDKNPYQFIFDTGSETTLINSDISSVIVSSDTIFFRDVFYELHSAHKVKVDTFTLGKIKVIGKNSYHQRKLNLDGVIGDDIIREFVWKFDLYNRNMYVSKDIINFDVDAVSVPFQRYGQFILITCQINNRNIDLIVDTGYNGFVSINKATADTIFTFHHPPLFWEGLSVKQIGNPYAAEVTSPRVDTTYYFTANMSVGEILLENEIIELSGNPFSIVGMDFFNRFNYFVLDYPNGMIHFGKQQHKSLTFIFSSLLRMNTKGITLVPKNKVQIGRINSWAKEAGINYYDTLLSINGISIVNRDSVFFKNNSRLDTKTNTFEFRPSPYQSLWNEFHFVKDTSIVEIKRGDSSQFYTLYRQYNFLTMPDSLHDYYIDLSLPLPNFHRVQTEAGTYYFRFKTEELVPWGLKSKSKPQRNLAKQEP